MRALVTGATGHIGSHLVRRLVDDGHSVVAVVRRSSSLARLGGALDGVQIIHADFADPPSLQAAVRHAAAEVIFHLGWFGVAGALRQDPRQVDHNILSGARLIEGAVETGCRCVIALGSQAEHGSAGGVLREDAAIRPATLYGAAKVAVGAILAAQAAATPSLRAVWVRVLATYGPADDDSHLIPAVTRTLLRGERPLLTAGEQRWDYLYVDDAVDALLALAGTTDAAGTFVLGSGQARSVRSIVERLRDLIDPALPLGFGDRPHRTDQPMHLEADITRIRSVTGWEPRTSLDEGLARTVAHYRTAG